jgi:hypothetical protein
MLISIDLLIVIIAVIVLSIFIYTFYDNIFTAVQPLNNKVGFFKKFKLSLIRLSSIGTVSTHVNNPSTVVDLSDADLDSLLQFVYMTIGDSNEISAVLLKSLGLYTSTVVHYLEQLGYVILLHS